jgi:Holliday junction resolvasome RuvABC endonuclease subunit
VTARLLALDPSFTSTGWVVVDLGAVPSGYIIAAGVIRTAPPKASERLLAAVADCRRGAVIRSGVTALLIDHDVTLVAMEAVAGSQSARSAAALARASQACWDACAPLGEPIAVTPAAVKQAAVGALGASKDAVADAMRRRWHSYGLLEAIRAARDAGLPFGQLEHVYDAAAVAVAVWDHPAVAGLRAVARAERAG